MTADEMLAMPDDGAHRYELVRGELITMSPAGWDHGNITDLIATHLSNHVRRNRLGKTPSSSTGYVLSRNPDTVREPDASFVRAERVIRSGKYFPGGPDLAVEVISPNDTWSEVDEKVREYLTAGTQMVIVINPRNQSATVYTPASTTRLTINDTLSGGDVVPGWSLPLAELFS
ncbi:MAG: Uma2 family endonuclease [Acidobacteria bacterium]|nr:MAG: Uma2 family endonuclease [Acidobacteriota bacterium]